MEIKLLGSTSAFPIGSARIREIRAIEVNLAKCEHGGRAFQKLPRHMQRRAVSSNPQRLPKSLREKHAREIGTRRKETKRPSRKYRRRASNLLLTYNRRQRENVWLETHIWHAKRFHMTKQWGYSLPKRPTNKSYRATIRAARESCLIHDVSYENCLELEGPISELMKAFGRILSTNDIASLIDVKVISGLSWTRVMLYHPDRMPMGAIGCAQVIWLPENVDSLRRLWMWIHPSISAEVCSLLTSLFSLERQVELEVPKEELQSENPNHVLLSKLALRNVPFQRIPKYVSGMNSAIKLNLLKDTLNKFRLIGPKSYYVLKKAIIPSVLTGNNNSEEPTVKESEVKMGWWKKLYSVPVNFEGNKVQEEVWKSVCKNDVTEDRLITIGLVIRDPRLTLPIKKQPILDENNSEKLPLTIPQTFYGHPIFNSKIRDNVSLNMKPTHEINMMRSRLLIPGTPYPIDDEESRVPALLLCNVTSDMSSLGYIWDLILPCGWGTLTWITLIMNGAMAAGVHHIEMLEREFLQPPSPYSLPDTQAAQTYASQVAAERERKYFRHPPTCRFNFLKLGITNPFGVDWLELVKAYNEGCEGYFVLRNEIILRNLASVTCKKYLRNKEYSKQNIETIEPPSKVAKIDEGHRVAVKEEEPILHIPGNCLIYVRVVLLGRGTVEPLALICLPTEEDLDTLASEMKLPGSSGVCNIVEPLHEDPNTKLRNDLKLKHIKDLKRLRRKRRKAREKVLCQDDPLTNASLKDTLNASVLETEIKEKDLVDRVAGFASQMNELWIKTPNSTSKTECIRRAFGYVTNGGFCARLGRSAGVGWVVAQPLLTLLLSLKLLSASHEKPDDYLIAGRVKNTGYPNNSAGETKTEPWNQVHALIRNSSGVQYRWARLVILNVS